MKSSKEVIAILSRSGLRITEQTKLICEIVFDRKDSWHPRAEDILQVLVKRKKKVSQATVYNVLNKLYAEKLLQEVTLDKGQHYFDTNLDMHYHLYYEKSGKLEDVHCDVLKLEGVDKLAKSEQIKKVDIIVHLK